MLFESKIVYYLKFSASPECHFLMQFYKLVGGRSIMYSVKMIVIPMSNSLTDKKFF